MKCCDMFFGWSRPADETSQSRSSDNLAFEDYRAEALRRLQEEQRDFESFLGRLRAAKDKEEFEQFLAARRAKHSPSST